MELLDEIISKEANRRRDLLPTWIKVFVWIFMIGGMLVPILFVAGTLGVIVHLSIYGIETVYPISILGFLIMSLFAIKGVVSYGLWTEKDWAIKLAIFDAIVGIIICTFMVIGLPFFVDNGGFNIDIRLELLILIPYLRVMKKIKSEWESYRGVHNL